MMSRFFHWTCDSCSLEVTKPSYGLPPGWLCVESNQRDGHPTLHFCGSDCHIKRFPKDEPDKDDVS
jgi:hypothetical protein